MAGLPSWLPGHASSSVSVPPIILSGRSLLITETVLFLSWIRTEA